MFSGRRKECVGRRSRGKKYCNGNERVKSVLEEVEWRVFLKRFWGAKEPGKRDKVSAAREGRRNGLGAVVESESLWGVWKIYSRRVEYKKLLGGNYGEEFATVIKTILVLGNKEIRWGVVSGGKECQNCKKKYLIGLLILIFS